MVPVILMDGGQTPQQNHNVNNASSNLVFSFRMCSNMRVHLNYLRVISLAMFVLNITKAKFDSRKECQFCIDLGLEVREQSLLAQPRSRVQLANTFEVLRRR